MQGKANTPDTLPKILLQQYRAHGSKKIAMRKKDYGVWNEYTWQDVYMHVEKMAFGLKALGMERGDKVCILGDNDPEWFWAQLAAQCIGGVAIGIFIDCNPPEVKYYLEHSDARFIFARDQEQVDKVLKIQYELPMLMKIIYWDGRGLWFYKEDKLISIQELESLGEKHLGNSPENVEESISLGKASDIAVICYTSGTTGRPKGAMISYKNLNALYEQIVHVERFHQNDEYLSYISPAWITEQMLAISCGMRIPFVVNFPEKPETVQEDVRNVGPQLLFYGARLWENLAAFIQVKIIDTTPFKRFVYNQGLRLGYRKVDALMKKEDFGFLSRFLMWAADFFIMRPLRDRIGLLRVRSCFTAGASISPDIMKLFHAIGINLKNLYGSTEAGLITWHRDGDIRAETVGAVMPGVEIRISETGEICARSEGVFEGYYKNAEATAQRMKDGFYCTGDAGYIDERGHLIYYDRVEDMVDLADGTRFSPQYIESRLRFSVFIKDAIVIGGKNRRFVIALVNMDYENVAKWAEKRKMGFTTFADLSQKKDVGELIREEIIRVNQFVTEAGRIKAFVVLPKEFDPDEAEMTRTRKLKRSPIEDRYSALMTRMYRGETVFEVESEIQYQDGRTGKTKTVVVINQV